MEHLEVKDGVLSLIMDECFQQWVYASEESHNLFWESWLKKYPAKRKDIEEAKSMLSLLRFKRSEWSASRMEKVKQSIKGNDQ
jgi:hypothetical protein